MIPHTHIFQRRAVPIARLGLALILVIVLPMLVRASGFLYLSGDSVAAAVTTRVSVASDGTEGGSGSYKPVVSSDGRYVAYESYAENLVGDDDNGQRDVFVHDRQTGQTVRVSVATDGSQGNHFSAGPAISADGRYVAFYSYASDLVSGDNNGVHDVFVRDRDTDEDDIYDEPGAVSTTRISVNPLTSQEGNGRCDGDISVSADGRYIAFESSADNLVSSDSNGKTDVFVYDQQSHSMTVASVPDKYMPGSESNGYSGDAAISPCGRYVGFKSGAQNLVGEGGNGWNQVFLRDLDNQRTYLVSKAVGGGLANDNSTLPSVSGGGRYVAFGSGADNLVAGDTTSGSYDVFVRDMLMGQTVRISEGVNGEEVVGISSMPEITPDGRYVVFFSEADDLVSGDDNGYEDVLVRDRDTDEDDVFDEAGAIALTRVSVRSDGGQGSEDSRLADISYDGSVVAFESRAWNLVDGDNNSSMDIFVKGPSLTPDLWLSKRVDNTSPAPGQTITYTISVYNAGLQSATGAVVSDTLPAGINFVGPVTIDPASAGTPGTPPALATGLTINVGERITITFPTTVSLGLAYGTHIANVAVITSTQVSEPEVDSEVITVHAPLFLFKDVDDDSPAPGQQINYTINVYNAGPDGATGAVVSDTLPAGLNYVGPVTIDPPGAGSPGVTPPILVNDLAIAADERVTITFPVTVGLGLDYGVVLTNTAAVTSTQVITPQMGSKVVIVTAEVYLPLVLRNY